MAGNFCEGDLLFVALSDNFVVDVGDVHGEEDVVTQVVAHYTANDIGVNVVSSVA